MGGLLAEARPGHREVSAATATTHALALACAALPPRALCNYSIVRLMSAVPLVGAPSRCCATSALRHSSTVSLIPVPYFSSAASLQCCTTPVLRHSSNSALSNRCGSPVLHCASAALLQGCATMRWYSSPALLIQPLTTLTPGHLRAPHLLL